MSMQTALDAWTALSKNVPLWTALSTLSVFKQRCFYHPSVQSMVCIDSDVWTKQRCQLFSAVDRRTTLSADCCRWLHPDIDVYAKTAMDEMHHCWTSMFLLTIDVLP